MCHTDPHQPCDHSQHKLFLPVRCSFPTCDAQKETMNPEKYRIALWCHLWNVLSVLVINFCIGPIPGTSHWYGFLLKIEIIVLDNEVGIALSASKTFKRVLCKLCNTYLNFCSWSIKYLIRYHLHITSASDFHNVPSWQGRHKLGELCISGEQLKPREWVGTSYFLFSTALEAKFYKKKRYQIWKTRNSNQCGSTSGRDNHRRM